MRWGRGIAVWALLMAVESVHGSLRIWLLAPRIGDLAARRLSVLSGLLLIFLLTLWRVRWLQASSRAALLGIGSLWVGLTVMFECALGRLLFGYDWRRILSDYDLAHGGLMGIGLAGMLLMPWLCSKLRGVPP
jgi:hypothetical protein